MAELSAANGYVIMDLDDEWSVDGCRHAERRDILFAAAAALHLANGLQMLASSLLAGPLDDNGPSVEVFCVIDGRKPLVRWKLGRWERQLRLSPLRALALASMTRGAAEAAERRLKWLEERDPATLVG